MTERWQEVGRELGVELPERVGKLMLPLFDREQGGGLTIVPTAYGLLGARLVDDEPSADGGRRRTLISATLRSGRGLLAIETHRNHPVIKRPGRPSGCGIVDFTSNKVFLTGPPPRDGVGVAYTVPPESKWEEMVVADAVTVLNPFVKSQGIDLFHPDNTAVAVDALSTTFASHHFDVAMRMAATGEFGLHLPQ